MNFEILGLISFAEASAAQEQRAKERSAGSIDDLIIFCELEPVITLGVSTRPEHWLPLKQNPSLGKLPIVQTDRGGSVTYHGPGQLIIYPVISLRERRMGVRTFISTCLEVISDFARSAGVDARPELSPAGVWVGPKKIASTGLRITEGVTRHGFAVNLGGDLEIFKKFSPCGLEGSCISSILELTGRNITFTEGYSMLQAGLARSFCWELKGKEAGGV